MDKKSILAEAVLVLAMGLFFAFGLSAGFAEEITLTTYYPSPYGVYEEMRSKKMAIGDAYYDSSSHCWPGGPCPSVIDGAADLVVEGNVGIGTTNPSEELDVDGNVKATGYKTGSETGQTTTVTVVTDVRIIPFWRPVLQKRTRSLTFTNGLLTAEGAESRWH